MRAILLVYDETEDAYISRPLTYTPPGASALLQNPPAEELVKFRCNCVRNGAIQKAKRLLRHLRGVMALPKKNIWFLRTSRFKSSAEILRAMRIFIRRYRNEDIVFFVAAHGSPSRWFFGKCHEGEKSVYYYQLENMLAPFTGRLILINECCHALAIHRYLAGLASRYLLLGLSRPENVGDAFRSVLNAACKAWEQSEIADVRSSGVYAVRDALNSRIRNMEIVQGDAAVMRMPLHTLCTRCAHHQCGDIVVGAELFPAGEELSLRRGSKLDFLCFPKER